MAEGYFIRNDDETTCGVKLLEADTNVMIGIAYAHVYRRKRTD